MGGMVTIFDPQGNAGEIPVAQLNAAVKAGATPAVHMKSPDGSDGYIPANRTHEALSAGATLLPIEDQEIKHPGFWSALGEDLWGMAKPFVKPPTSTEEIDQRLRMLNKLSGGVDPRDLQEALAQNAAEKKAGYGALYRYFSAPAATAIGVNVPGMEASAAQGDVGGVAGHAAAVPVAAAATEGVARVLPKVPGVVRGIGENETLGKLSASAKVLGHSAEELPGVGSTVRAVRKLRQLGDIWRGPLDATGENVPYAGEEAPQSVAGSLVNAVTAPTRTIGDLAAPDGAGIPRTLSGESALRTVLGAQENANLLKIARSRGINVTQEAQLRPGVANPKIIEKIVNDFSPEQLSDVRDQWLENRRFGHDFSGVEKALRAQGYTGAALVDKMQEFWNTLSLQSYFPDVKIPAQQLIRTQTAISNAKIANDFPEMRPLSDLAGEIKKANKGARGTAKAKSVTTAPAPTGTLLDQLNQMDALVKSGKKLKDLSPSP